MSYAALALVFVAGSALVSVAAALLARPPAAWWVRTALVGVVLVVLTAVFDSLMIAADLFRFDESQLLGLHVGLAPVEDFAWPVASTLVLPALWVLLGRRRAGREER